MPKSSKRRGWKSIWEPYVGILNARNLKVGGRGFFSGGLGLFKNSRNCQGWVVSYRVLFSTYCCKLRRSVLENRRKGLLSRGKAIMRSGYKHRLWSQENRDLDPAFIT